MQRPEPNLLLSRRCDNGDFHTWLAGKNTSRIMVFDLVLAVIICLSYMVHPEVPYLHGSAMAGTLCALGFIRAGQRQGRSGAVAWGKALSIAAAVAWTLISVTQTLNQGGYGLPQYFIGVMAFSIFIYMELRGSVLLFSSLFALYLCLIFATCKEIPAYVFINSFIFSGFAMILSRSMAREKAYYFRTKTLVATLNEKNRTLSRLSMMDTLTDLPNRRYFDKLFNTLWEDRAGQKSPLVLILGDIDYFKTFNDTHGHVKGDDCLAGVARTLERNVRRDAPVMRIGGEEFAILLEDTSIDEGEAVALRLAESVRTECPVTMSFGVAAIHPGEGSALALYETADKALYRAKNGGRDRVAVEAA